MGSIQKSEDCNVVADDFMLTTAADIVADPSRQMHSSMASWKVRNGFGRNGILKGNEVAKYKGIMDASALRNWKRRPQSV